MRAAAPLPLMMLAMVGGLLSGCALVPGGEVGRDRVAGRVYVVTGASSGFGRGVAVRLGGLGARVVLAARRGAVLEEVAAEVRAAGGEALVVVTDMADPAQVEALAAAAVARFGRIDAWVNNAAVASLGRFEEVPVADHARAVDVNLKGVIYGAHAAIRRFRAQIGAGQAGGVLVNVSSVEGRVPLPYHAVYAATKAGILSLGQSLTQEMRLARMSGAIGIATVLPWAVDTPFWEHAGNYTGRRAQVGLLDGPEAVVEAIVRASVHPRREIAVGFKANLAVIGSQAWPGLAQRIGAEFVQRTQMDAAPPAPATEGAVHRPVPQGTGVAGGLRARMAED